MIKELSNVQEFETLLETSNQQAIFVFKHSTACPISGNAWQNFLKFAQLRPDLEFWRVLVIQQRSVSIQIAEKSGISHQSPQVILFYQQQPIWHASHGAIQEAALNKALTHSQV